MCGDGQFTTRIRRDLSNMAAAALHHLFELVTLFLSLFPNSITPNSQKKIELFPPTCTRIECPTFHVIEVGNGYEIRRYNSTVWMSTSPIQDISLVEATRNGFLQLFDYIQGENQYQQHIEMTAPVITQVSAGDGPLCESSFVVSFYVPGKNQANPPPADGLHVQRWRATYAAVRQFSGFVSDYEVGEEAAALKASLAGSLWSAAIDSSNSSYIVAQYNSPFEFDDRVNEIWMTFDMEDKVDALV